MDLKYNISTYLQIKIENWYIFERYSLNSSNKVVYNVGKVGNLPSNTTVISGLTQTSFASK
jgi:hypothetical protein